MNLYTVFFLTPEGERVIPGVLAVNETAATERAVEIARQGGMTSYEVWEVRNEYVSIPA